MVQPDDGVVPGRPARACGPDVEAMLAAALDALGAGLVIVDASLAIVHRNAAACRLMRSGCGLSERDGRLCAGLGTRTEQLHARVRRVAAAGRGARELFLLPPRSIGADRAGPLEIACVALPPRAGAPAGPVAVAVWLFAAGRAGVPDMGAARALYGLTGAEAGFARHVVAGLGVVEASARAGIAEPTGRRHMQAVLRKTGTRRQAALAACIAGGACGQLAPPDDAP